MSRKAAITLNINGRGYPIEVESRRTLADAIREDCGQTGTHIGCEHGICGACTVIVDGEPVRSCLMFAVQADGKKIRTVEGLRTSSRQSELRQKRCKKGERLRSCRLKGNLSAVPSRVWRIALSSPARAALQAISHFPASGICASCARRPRTGY